MKPMVMVVASLLLIGCGSTSTPISVLDNEKVTASDCYDKLIERYDDTECAYAIFSDMIDVGMNEYVYYTSLVLDSVCTTEELCTTFDECEEDIECVSNVYNVPCN